MQEHEFPVGDERIGVPDGTCLLAYRGSVAHGMYVPKSDLNSIDDVDLMGVVLAPVEHYLGLTEWGSRGTYGYQRGKWDCVFYEIRKMFGLLLQGNPNVMSLLWLRETDYLHLSDVGREILRNRGLFVGKHVFHSFAGYAQGQLQRMESRDPAELRQYIAVTNELKARGAHPNHKGERIPHEGSGSGEEKAAASASTEVLLQQLRHFQKKGENIGYMGDRRKRLVLEHGYDAKNAAHCIRLLRMCIEFLRSGEMTVYRPDGAELLEIKRGEWTLERVKRHAEELVGEAKAAYEGSTLPESPDWGGTERLLVGVLRDWIGAV
jgi:uncharacterized protein